MNEMIMEIFKCLVSARHDADNLNKMKNLASKIIGEKMKVHSTQFVGNTFGLGVLTTFIVSSQKGSLIFSLFLTFGFLFLELVILVI